MNAGHGEGKAASRLRPALRYRLGSAMANPARWRWIFALPPTTSSWPCPK